MPPHCSRWSTFQPASAVHISTGLDRNTVGRLDELSWRGSNMRERSEQVGVREPRSTHRAVPVRRSSLVPRLARRDASLSQQWASATWTSLPETRRTALVARSRLGWGCGSLAQASAIEGGRRTNSQRTKSVGGGPDDAGLQMGGNLQIANPPLDNRRCPTAGGFPTACHGRLTGHP